MTDFNAVPEFSMALLQGLDDLILDALRDTPHPMHVTVEQALQSSQTPAKTRLVHSHRS